MSGEFTTSASPNDVFDFLADPRTFGPLLPDFQSMTQEDATHFALRLGIGVAQFRGTVELKMELAESARAQRAVYRGSGLAAGSNISTRIAFDLAASQPAGTVVRWECEADVTGKLAMMAGSMMHSFAGKGMTKLMDGLKGRLDWKATLSSMRKASEEATVNDSQLGSNAPSSDS